MSRLVFNDENKLRDMIVFRKSGWTYHSLALVFGVDHSSIYSACKNRGIKRSKRVISLNISKILSDLDISIPKIKSYKDYLNERKKYTFPKIYSLLYEL